jgi:hypothetical protein
MRKLRWSILVLTVVSGLVTACAPPAAEPAGEEGPALVEDIAGSDVKRLTLTEDAAQRIGIEMVPVTSASGGHTMVPSSTVIYDAGGQTWVYTSPETDVFVRAPVTLVDIDGDDALLSAGPPIDTQVVTVGVAELYGSELGVGDPE